MDPSTAKVYLRSYLDFERKSAYVLIIQVTDNGVPQRRSSTTLLSINVKDINDNAPVILLIFIFISRYTILSIEILIFQLLGHMRQ
jgi:hypothetical protein